jgi:hypothetical protein
MFSENGSYMTFISFITCVYSNVYL